MSESPMHVAQIRSRSAPRSFLRKAPGFRSLQLWVLLWAGWGLVPCRGATVVSDSHRIRVTLAERSSAEQWLRIAGSASELVARTLGRPPKRVPFLTLALRKTGRKDGTNPLKLTFPAGTPDATICHYIIRGLVLRRAAGPSSGRVSLLPSAEWISAGLTHRLLFSERTTLDTIIPDYEVARLLFGQRVFPDVRRLLTGPVMPEDGIAYHLYGLHCDLFLAAMESASPRRAKPVREILRMEAHGRDTLESVEFVCQPLFEKSDTLQSWYERTATDVSRKGRRLNRAARVAERLRELETVPTVSLGNTRAGCVRMPIEEIPDRLQAYRLDKEAVGALQSGLFEIIKDAPLLLRNPLAAYMPAFQALAEGKVWRFKRRLKKARKAFHKALARQQTVEAYLDALESDMSPMPERFAVYTRISRRHARLERALDPDLFDYLDEFE